MIIILKHHVIIVNPFAISAAQDPGWVTVILKSQFGIPLGEIKILYVDEEKEFLLRIVNEPSLQYKLMKELEVNAKRAGGGETQNSENLGKAIL